MQPDNKSNGGDDEHNNPPVVSFDDFADLREDFMVERRTVALEISNIHSKMSSISSSQEAQNKLLEEVRIELKVTKAVRNELKKAKRFFVGWLFSLLARNFVGIFVVAVAFAGGAASMFSYFSA